MCVRESGGRKGGGGELEKNKTKRKERKKNERKSQVAILPCLEFPNSIHIASLSVGGIV